MENWRCRSGDVSPMLLCQRRDPDTTPNSVPDYILVFIFRKIVGYFQNQNYVYLTYKVAFKSSSKKG